MAADDKVERGLCSRGLSEEQGNPQSFTDNVSLCFPRCVFVVDTPAIVATVFVFSQVASKASLKKLFTSGKEEGERDVWLEKAAASGGEMVLSLHFPTSSLTPAPFPPSFLFSVSYSFPDKCAQRLLLASQISSPTRL